MRCVPACSCAQSTARVFLRDYRGYDIREFLLFWHESDVLRSSGRAYVRACLCVQRSCERVHVYFRASLRVRVQRMPVGSEAGAFPRVGGFSDCIDVHMCVRACTSVPHSAVWMHVHA